MRSGSNRGHGSGPRPGKLAAVPSAVPQSLLQLASRSAAPEKVNLALLRLASGNPSQLALMDHGGSPTQYAQAFVAVVAASDSLGLFCTSEPAALGVLADLGNPAPRVYSDARTLGVAHRLEVLRIAARDLLGIDILEQVTHLLSETASWVLDASVGLAGGGGDGDGGDGERIAVIGMGKLGGDELNYSSDVDVMFVTDTAPEEDLAKRILAIARNSFRVDADLRPEGRAGPLTKTIDGYRSYWARWAQTWEFQALIKAKPVAGDVEVGTRFDEAVAAEVWERAYSADELALIRRMKERSEAMVANRGLSGRELKRSAGGIRDVEFAVQLLQLVHGRRDPTIRGRSTLGALNELAESGYVGRDEAASLADAYRFLRTVEHRVQLVGEQQTHTVPSDSPSRERLARVLGFEDAPGSTATAQFDEALRVCRKAVRSLHERLFFRPLLEAFAVSTTASPLTQSGMSPQQVAERLSAFGFAGTDRTKAAVDELAQGLTRSSRLMGQMLPLLLDWLSVTPDPDLGLLGLRNLALHSHQRSRLVTTFRESPEAARRLCLLLGSSLTLGEAVARNPELIAGLGDNAFLATDTPDRLKVKIAERLKLRTDRSSRRADIYRFKQEELVRIAIRDLLDIDDVAATGEALASVADSILQAGIGEIDPEVPFCVIGLGRFGGGELSYASDLDVLFVHGKSPKGDGPGEVAAERLLHLIHGPSPSDRIFSVDLGLRPEGGQGRLSRDVDGYALYFERWAQTWERQALVRARFVAGDSSLGDRFMELAREFVWNPPIGPDEISEIRRMKARIERERIPAGEDPQFHLKLGKGSLSDVEWTVQLLQLENRVEGTGTMATLSELERLGILHVSDGAALRGAYRFCEHTRNRWHLVGALPGGVYPGDSLPTQAHQLSKLARSLANTPAALRDDYRRVTRRSRKVVERLFYGIEDPESR